MKKRISLVASLLVFSFLTASCGNTTAGGEESSDIIFTGHYSAPDVVSQESDDPGFAVSEGSESVDASEETSSTQNTSSATESAKDPEDERILYRNQCTVQGICASEDFLFVSYSPSRNGNKNDYKIRKVDLVTGEVLMTSKEKFNHANGMTYNKNTNEVIVCAFDGNSGSTETTSDDDYCLFVVDADTLTLKEKVNLKDAVLSVYDKSCGIGGVTYSAEKDEYYALTRFPDRYILVFDGEFNLKDDIFLYSAAEMSGTTGDLCFDGTYFYIPYWRSDIDKNRNDVVLFDTRGRRVATYAVDGATHIESLDIVGDKLYASFINYIGSSSEMSQVYVLPILTESINMKK